MITASCKRTKGTPTNSHTLRKLAYSQSWWLLYICITLKLYYAFGFNWLLQSLQWSFLRPLLPSSPSSFLSHLSWSSRPLTQWKKASRLVFTLISVKTCFPSGITSGIRQISKVYLQRAKCKTLKAALSSSLRINTTFLDVTTLTSRGHLPWCGGVSAPSLGVEASRAFTLGTSACHGIFSKLWQIYQVNAMGLLVEAHPWKPGVEQNATTWVENTSNCLKCWAPARWTSGG